MNKRLLGSLCFIIILIVSVYSIQGIFVVNDSLLYERIGMLRKEKPGTIDAIYIGTSCVHFSWIPLYGWNQEGIAVWNYSVGACNPSAITHMIAEARKTQPDALYMINLNTFKYKSARSSMIHAHWHLDFFPNSLTKIQLMNSLSDNSGYSLENKAELLFPIIRFHSRWDSLSDWAFTDLTHLTRGTKVLNGVNSQFPEQFKIYDSASATVPGDIWSAMENLLDYGDQHHVNILFVKSPQVSDEEEQGRLNELEHLVTSRGYQCVDLFKNTEAFTLDLKSDFLDKVHMNIHGSIKFSRYLGNYLKDHYGFTDKRGSEGWEEWDQAGEELMDKIRKKTLPFEIAGKRTNLPAPAFVVHKPSFTNVQTEITWDPVDEADGYEVYRETDDMWELAADTDQQKYTDDTVEKAKYTVVPYRILNDEKHYGHFDVKGIPSS